MSSEEHSPAELVHHARAAEEAGFGFGLISDHIHPWVDARAMQPQAAELAGRIGDALINVAPKKEIVQQFEEGGGKGKPRYGQITVCYARSKDEAKKTAFQVWPNALVEGSASQELPLPKDFEQLVEGREADELEETLTLGPDPDEYLDELKEYVQAGYTHVYFHQIGPEQEAFLMFAQSELLPKV